MKRAHIKSSVVENIEGMKMVNIDRVNHNFELSTAFRDGYIHFSRKKKIVCDDAVERARISIRTW